MKKYKLKQWYPSLGSTWITGDIAVKSAWDYYYHTEYPNGYLPTETEVENNPDFWELIEEKKPLFITDDGVEVFDKNSTVYCITRGYNKHDENYISMRKIESYLKVFSHESNADDYIWKNKPVFSYEDFIKWGNAPYQRVIEQLAKERI